VENRNDPFKFELHGELFLTSSRFASSFFGTISSRAETSKKLGPVLEAAVRKHPYQIALAKLDTEANPEVIAAMGVTSIPTVFGVVHGKVAGKFEGYMVGQARPLTPSDTCHT
jgi:hypothetical protein